MSAFITMVQDFLYFGLAVSAVIGGITVFSDVYGRKSKKEEYLSELEALERIHASKKVSEAVKEPEKSEEAKKQ